MPKACGMASITLTVSGESATQPTVSATQPFRRYSTYPPRQRQNRNQTKKAGTKVTSWSFV